MQHRINFTGFARLFFTVAMLSGCSALSLDEEIRLGEEQVSEIASNANLVTDPQVVAYIDALTNRILEASPTSPYQFNVRIIRSDAFNAFAIPGANIYLTTGVIMGSRNVSELASILAHEVAHVTRGHISNSFRRFRNSRTTAQLASITLAIATGNPFIAGAGDVAANLGSTAYISAHTREGEKEADEFAFRVMQKAGYDPRSQLTVMARLNALTIGQSTAPPFLLTHPLPAQRMVDVQNRLKQLSGEQQFVVNDNGQLEAIKARLL